MVALLTQFFGYLDAAANPLNAIILIAIFILIFILLREFFCWYFKINERIDILKKIERHTAPKVERKMPPPDDAPPHHSTGARR